MLAKLTESETQESISLPNRNVCEVHTARFARRVGIPFAEAAGHVEGEAAAQDAGLVGGAAMTGWQRPKPRAGPWVRYRSVPRAARQFLRTTKDAREEAVQTPCITDKV